MNKDELIEVLSNLVQVDIDALHAYEQVVKEIDDEVLHSRIEEFREEHRNHIKTLSEEIRVLGGKPPEMSLDFKGFVIEGFAALGSLTGMKAALQALKLTEQITIKYYGEAIPQDVPGPLKDTLRRYFSQEKNHLNYYDRNLQALS